MKSSESSGEKIKYWELKIASVKEHEMSEQEPSPKEEKREVLVNSRLWELKEVEKGRVGKGCLWGDNGVCDQSCDKLF